MAKRKLSESQRKAIRLELATLLRTAKTKAEAFRTVAKKYGITTITARWYAKSLKGAPAKAKAPKAAAPAPAAKKPAPAAPAKARASAAARNGHTGVTGALGKLVAGVQATAEKAIARARQAKGLLPRWHVYVKKEHSLRKIERRVRQELQAVARKARALEEKIKGLTS